MDELEKHFIEGIKTDDKCLDILNWYRNLYYKENDTTERGIMARAINDLFMNMQKNYKK